MLKFAFRLKNFNKIKIKCNCYNPFKTPVLSKCIQTWSVVNCHSDYFGGNIQSSG